MDQDLLAKFREANEPMALSGALLPFLLGAVRSALVEEGIRQA